VLHEAQNRNIPGIISLIDFEKAFDSISWKFMYKTLKFFNFGPELIRWINVLIMRLRSVLSKMAYSHNFSK
jgi:hypothetical protein